MTSLGFLLRPVLWPFSVLWSRVRLLVGLILKRLIAFVVRMPRGMYHNRLHKLKTMVNNPRNSCHVSISIRICALRQKIMRQKVSIKDLFVRLPG